MSTARTSLFATLGRGAWSVCLGLVVSGCATANLNSARQDFYSGRYEQAIETLSPERVPRRNQVLFLMERGAARQAMGDYEGSARDFIHAYDLLTQLEAYSVSQGAGSLIINDNIKEFVGAPFERTLLHAMTAQNHLARGDWDNAAVEARRILQSLDEEYRGKFPDEPYSRYLAGLAFELIDDPSNAALQYRLANERTPHVAIDPDTGRLGPPPPPESDDENGSATITRSTRAPNVSDDWRSELVAIIQLGRAPGGHDSGAYAGHPAQYAEIYADGRYLGRSYLVSNTGQLRHETEQARALMEAAKTVTRVVLKEGVAVAVEHNNGQLAGDLVRLILFGLFEQPDLRRWETLPRWFHIARVPVPPDFESFDVVLKSANGAEVRRVTVTEPLQRRRNTYISFFR